jgi:hypothetical protein
MLDGETTIVKDYGLTDISPDNYEFRLTGEETVNGGRCHVIEIVPRRADKTLIRGTILVDAGTYLLHRMEGEPARSPSWWLTGARITFHYSDVEGMWLQTASEFTTHVRIFGRHTMTSRDVGYEAVEAHAPAATLVGAKSPAGSIAEGPGGPGRRASGFPNR